MSPASRLPRIAAGVEWKDRVLNAVLFGTAVVTVAILILLAFAIPQIRSGTANTKAQVRSDRLTACRSAFRTDIDSATLDLQVATAKGQTLITRAVGAAVTGDRELLRSIGFELLAVDVEKDQAIEDVDRANRAYKAAVLRSTDDPETFVAECQSRDRKRTS